VSEHREHARFERELGGVPVDVPAVEDLVADVGDRRVPLRVYHHAIDAPQPWLLWIHGGGWFVGDLETCEPVCRLLAARSGCAVVACDYRLAPEHPFPAGLDDCCGVLGHLVGHGATLGLDPERVAVGGDSAGGNLSAAVALHARDSGIALRLQLLAEPALHPAFDGASRRDFATGYTLTAGDIEWMWGMYLDGAAADPRAAPLLGDDLAGVAPAVILASGCDLLRDEAEAYAARLVTAGLPVTSITTPGLAHGSFTYFGHSRLARGAVEAAADAVARALG
jgi:acetyl esterase